MNKRSKEEYLRDQAKYSVVDSINLDNKSNLSWDNIVSNVVKQCEDRGKDYIVAFNIYPNMIARLGYPLTGIIMDN